MRRLVACLVSTLPLAVSARGAAEPVREFETNAELHAGVADAPFFTAELPEAKGRGVALVVSGWWHEVHGCGVGLSVPLVAARIREPDGSSTDEPSWGNPMFWGERRVPFAPGGFDHAEGWLRLGVGAPLADMGPRDTLTKNRALAIADAIDGWQHRESFVPGVVPFTVAAGVAQRRGIIRGEASAKLVPMVRFDDAFLPEPTRHGFGLSALASAGGSVWPMPVLGFGAVASLVIDAVPVATSPRADTLQLVLSPSIAARPGSRVNLRTEVMLPVAGALGGNTFGFGFRAAVEW